MFGQAQVDLFATQVSTQRNVPTGAGCHGTDVADASSVRCSPIALLPGVLASFLKLTPVPTARAFMLPGRLRHPARDVSPIRWTDYTCVQSAVTLGAFPKASQDATSHSLEELGLHT